MRARSITGAFGATIVTGLKPNVDMPIVSTGASAVWHATETTAPSPTDQVFEQLSLRPKLCSASTTVTRQLLVQGGIEGIVESDLRAAIAEAVDVAALGGSGTGGVPKGIANNASVKAITGTALAWSGVLDFAVNAGDLDCSGYATTAAIYKLLANRARLSGGSIPIINDQTIDGRPVRQSSAVPAGAMIAGPWPQLLIAIWSGVQILVDGFTGMQAGLVTIKADLMLDVGVRNPAAFSVASSIT